MFVISYFTNCSPDEFKELGNGYFLRIEGKDYCDILCHNPGGKEIPVNVISYNFNREYIIAAQKPGEFDNSIYNNQPIYKYGRDKIYYWIVIHKFDLVLGPLSESEYNNARIIYSIPKKFQLKTIE